MKFTKIYRLISLPGDNKISLEAKIEDGETAEDVDCGLRLKLSELIGDERVKSDLLFEKRVLEEEIRSLKNDAQFLKDFKTEHLKVFRKAGLEFDDFLESDIPF